MRIGLIAMSGVRCCDEELLELGLTLPGFVERSKTIASLPSLGLLTLAAATPPEHEVEYLEVPDPRAFGELPKGFDLVAISSYSAQIREAYAFAERFRDAGIPVVMGGPHVTALPDEALEHCDVAVVGEGEACWQQVLADFAAGRPEQVYDALPLDYDLSQSPVPAYELLDISKYNRLTVQTSRGCPHRCEFCASSVLLTDRYKQKPVENVLAEIDRILSIWERPFIEFADDNAFVNKSWWKEFLSRLENRRFRWFAECDIAVSTDDELLDLMRRTGCAQVLIGLESPVEKGLANIELRRDWKRRMYPQYADAIHTIQSHGIAVNGCFVLGLDRHTPEVFDRVYDFVRDVGLYEVQITILTAFPGTPLYHRLEEEGRLLEPEAWHKCTLFDINHRPTDMTPRELHQGFRDLAVRLYSDELTRWRRRNFRENLRRRAG
jgi:radical SAM superfamily enzyme YgiQ (UPF0313 family)